MKTPFGSLVATCGVLTVFLVAGNGAAQGAAASSGSTPGPAVHLLVAPAHGPGAITRLGGRLDEAAGRNHLTPHALQRLLRRDPTAWLDRQGRIFYVEADRAMVGSGGITAPPAPHPYADTFRLHSLTGSSHTIFLDFDGATVSGTQWNTEGVDTAPQPAFDMDGDPSTFSQDEQDMIQEVWRQVGEDYAPFDVDVTTEDPGEAALVRSSLDDQQYGVRVLLTPSEQAATALCGNSCGGVAYVAAFAEPGSAHYQPAWVFTHLQWNTPEMLATTASHEAGHTFGLHHDGVLDGSPYYDGDSQWAPLMGGPSWGVSQWSKGEYPNADNAEDDVAVIAAGGAPLRADDHGDTAATATALGSASPVSVSGLISKHAGSPARDVDVFSFEAACDGAAHITVRPETRGADVDLGVRVLDRSGAQVTAADLPVSGDLDTGMSGLDDDITLPLAQGTYYAEVAGAGVGYPAEVGYTDYGSMGRYRLEVSHCTAGATDTPTAATVPGRARITGARSGRPGGRITAKVTWAAPDAGGSPITGYRVVALRLNSAGRVVGRTEIGKAASARSASVRLPRKARYRFRVRAVNVVGAGRWSARSAAVRGR